MCVLDNISDDFLMNIHDVNLFSIFLFRHKTRFNYILNTFHLTVCVCVCVCSGGSTGGGFRGFKPPLGLPSKNLMCIEKRHHNMSRPTLCSYSTLSQAQLQTIGFKPPPPPLGLPSEHVTLSWTAFYGLHCVSRCQENITYGGSK